MHWIIEGLANVFLEILGDLMSWAVQLLTDFRFDMSFNIGFAQDPSMADSSGYTPGMIIDFATKHGSLIERTFDGAEQFTPIIMGMAAGIVLISFITKMIVAMGGPFTNSDDPGTITIRTIFAFVGVAFSYSIFALLEWVFDAVYGDFMTKFTTLTEDASNYAKSIAATEETKKTKEYTPSIGDPQNSAKEGGAGYQAAEEAAKAATADDSADDAYNMLSTNLFNQDYKDGQNSIAMTLIVIALFAILLIAFLKLLLEVYERYVMLGVLYYFAPLAFSTLVNKNSNVFSSYIQMVICEFIVMCSNLFFTSVFIRAWVTILKAEDHPDYLFEDSATFVTTMFLLISWLMIGQQFDQHLKGLGLSSATTGAGLGGALMAGGVAAAGSAVTAAKALGGKTLGTGGKLATGQTGLQRSIRDGVGPIGSWAKRAGKTPLDQKDGKKFFDNLDQKGKAELFANQTPEKQTEQITRNHAAAMGGEARQDRALKAVAGQGVGDIRSASYPSKGVVNYSMKNGKEVPIFDKSKVDTKNMNTTDKDMPPGFTRPMTDNEIQSKAESYLKSDDFKALSDTWMSDKAYSGLELSKDNTYIRGTYTDNDGSTGEEHFKIPGLVPGSGYKGKL